MMFVKTLLVVAIALLAGCVNYAGMHTQAKLIQPSDLHTKVSKDSIHTAWLQDKWWTQFHDPQLDALEEQAIANSPNLKVSEARLRIAAQQAKQANAALLPSLSAAGNVQLQRFSQNAFYPPSFIPTNFTLYGVQLNLNYDFDFWGKNREALKAALSETKATAADLAASRLILTAAVAQAYFQIQADKARIRIAQDLTKQRAGIAELTQLQRQQGLTSDLEVQQTRSDKETTKVSLEQLQQSLEVDQHQLAALLGKSPEESTYVKDTLNKTSLALPAVLPANLIGRRPDVTALRWRVEEAMHNIKVAKAQFYPDINLSGSNFGYQVINIPSILFNGASTMGTFGPAISLPIFDAGNLRANLGTKNADFDVAVEQYNDKVITAMQEVADQVSTIKSLQKQRTSQDKNLQATKRNYELTNLRYRNGLDDALSSMQTKIPYLTQRDQQIQLALQHQIAMINLIKALGGGINSA